MIGDKIKQLRKGKGISQAVLARKLGITQGAVGQWENGYNTPARESIEALSKIFNVSVDYLLGNTELKTIIHVPILGRVQAGIPVSAIEDILGYEELDARVYSSDKEYFCLQIRGKSMEPRMQDGDIVVCVRQDTAENGDTCVMLVNGDEATIKKVKMSDQGIMLIPTNPAFEPIFYSNKEVKELPVRILGKVIELRAKF